MAVVLIWRAAVAIGASTRIVRSSQGTEGPSYGEVLEYFEGRGLWDFSGDPAHLSELLSEYAGYDFQVADFAAPFELRKVQLTWTSNDAAVATDDVRVATFHFLKLTGGVPDDAWVAGDFTALNTNFATWWNAIKDRFNSATTLSHLKVYKDGPEIEPPQVPVYDATLNIGGASGFDPLPPQVAVTVTEKAGSRLHWGRFYLPNPTNACCNLYGRLDSTTAADFADATDALYTSLRAAGLSPVVYRRALPIRQTAAEKRAGTLPGSIPARDASVWEITDIQVDDVFDVIRSRRWKYPTLRTQRAI